MVAKPATLKLMVDPPRNKVVFAECDGDFVDIILSFLTLPLGTIIRLMGKNSSIGSMDGLYVSVENLSNKFFIHEACKTMLLQPRSAAAVICNKLSINIDDSPSPNYYACKPSCGSEDLSVYPNVSCCCGLSMDRKVHLPTPSKADTGAEKGVFVKDMTNSFMVFDSLVVAPSSTTLILAMLRKHAVDDSGSLEEKVVHVTPDDVLKLLKRSLLSEAVLTDVFLTAQSEITSVQQRPISNDCGPLTAGKSTCSSPKIFKVKLWLMKHEKKVVWAEAKQDFVDLLFSFLTFPTGAIVKLLGGHSHLRLFDNLYQSIKFLSSDDCFVKGDCKELLLSPKLPPHFSIENKVIRVEEKEPDRYYMCRNSCCNSNGLSVIPNVRCRCNTITNKRMKLTDPKLTLGFSGSNGFTRKGMFVITDDLRVTPLSAKALLTLLNKADELEEMMIDVGEEEALALLHASLASETALTDAFLGKKK